MSERGFSLIEVVIALGVMAFVLAGAMEVVVALPALAARWDTAAEARQRLRVIDARGARLVRNAAPIAVPVGAAIARVPSVWPRRLGLTGAGAPGDVAAASVTFLSRVDAHRVLVLDEALGATGGSVAARAGPGCGTALACGVAEGDILLAVSSANAVGLYRVTQVGARLTLDALMPAAAFGAGDVLVPVAMASLIFEAGELRLYDGYRSNNVIVDEIAAGSVSLEAGPAPRFEPSERGGPFVDQDGAWRGTGRLGDGPWAGAGALAFDVDQLAVRAVGVDVALTPRPGAADERALFVWTVR